LLFQFNRYSLAEIVVGPYAAVCNQRNPHITYLQEFFREFRKDSQPFVLGGTIYENHDLVPGRYTVTDDLHVVPGAKLTIAPGSILEFHEGIGMLVQGELSRTEFFGPEKQVIFTSKPFVLPKGKNIRLVDDDGNDEVTEGRLEVLIDGTWGTVCNRTWSAQLAQLSCNQLGLITDPEFFENWRIFRSKGELPMVMDNIRCEENEVDITKCRHDGIELNVAAGCRPTEVVAIRCAEPRWAGVRYSLLANPPTFTGQTTMSNWIIEKAGLFDFRTPEFSPALQIDWNYHVFHNLNIRNNFWNGIDIVYNDLIKKPAIRKSIVTNNRRNGVHLRSVGITLEDMIVSHSGQAGLRYNPQVSSSLQRDIVSWLDMREQPELEANNIYIIPDRTYEKIEVMESHLNQRKFLLAKETQECPAGPLAPLERCVFDMSIRASGFQYGLPAKIAIQASAIVNPASNVSDEDAVFVDQENGKSFSARHDSIQFPVVFTSNVVTMQYTRSFGAPKLIVLVLFLDAQEYLDRFIHLHNSVVEDNQYGISSIHYSNLSYADGTITNRWSNEKLWFQKVNFTRNSEAVIWMHSPQHEVLPNTPLSEIYYHLDNCSVTDNQGPVIETHRDLFSSANIFHWNIWSNTFANNTNSGVAVRLPDTYDLLAKLEHSFWMTENRFENNDNLYILLDGFYAFANISSNNFTDNFSFEGLMELRGVEKKLVLERNRFITNKATWMVKMAITSQSVRNLLVSAYIQYNYFLHNRFVKTNEDYVDSWPRSFAVGVFGAQKVDIHFNQLRNPMLDFEVVSGCRYTSINERMNVSYNWWGTGNDAEVAQRVFDFDDWNTFTLAEYSPFYITNELFINFWWNPRKGQLANATYSEPSVYDLKGRMFESKNLTLIKERWPEFPHYYKPFRPYRITRDLTIMPGATLWIEKGVEVHVWPNVRIMVLGDLVADGTYWEPIRFKPINTTEFDEMRGKIGTRYKRSSLNLRRRRRSDVGMRIQKWLRIRSRRADRARSDEVYSQFPLIYRDDPYYQRFTVSLTANSSIPNRAGFLQMYNATTGEVIPSCDRQFTVRNAQVVCRELGYQTMNAYHWVTPRWEYNPQIRLVKTYVEPRECRGSEPSLDR
uniref:SRCR domain-containing protein n=1 Tax=Heligmosomoides polygyrus TaxID=6339 RepID=A0A183G227_HELPZ